MPEYIERETALQLLNRNSITKKITLADGVSIYDTIKNMPTADVVEVRHGEWILSNTNPYGYPNIKSRTQKICSCCGWMNACRYAYCPNCGAKMDGFR